MKYKFVVFQSHLTKEWSWHAVSPNGKFVGWGGETHKRRSHAIKMAKAMAAGRKVYLKVGDTLELL